MYENFLYYMIIVLALKITHFLCPDKNNCNTEEKNQIFSFLLSGNVESSFIKCLSISISTYNLDSLFIVELPPFL